MAGHGPPPKPANKRRNTRVPASWGGASPTTVAAASGHDPDLGIDNPHELVTRMWTALQDGAEARFYSLADWERARLELWFVNEALGTGKPIPPNVWQQIQKGLNAMLVSPAEKRRAAIVLQPAGPDPDRDAAVLTIAKYQGKIDEYRDTIKG